MMTVFSDLVQQIEGVVSERDRLRAENEKLRALDDIQRRSWAVQCERQLEMLDNLRAENEKLKLSLSAWEESAQHGHPSPCNMGPLCPYCEIENLVAENEKLREFVADQLCDCYDEYNNKRSQMCRRCQLLGRE